MNKYIFECADKTKQKGWAYTVGATGGLDLGQQEHYWYSIENQVTVIVKASTERTARKKAKKISNRNAIIKLIFVKEL